MLLGEDPSELGSRLATRVLDVNEFALLAPPALASVTVRAANFVGLLVGYTINAVLLGGSYLGKLSNIYVTFM